MELCYLFLVVLTLGSELINALLEVQDLQLGHSLLSFLLFLVLTELGELVFLQVGDLALQEGDLQLPLLHALEGGGLVQFQLLQLVSQLFQVLLGFQLFLLEFVFALVVLFSLFLFAFLCFLHLLLQLHPLLLNFLLGQSLRL